MSLSGERARVDYLSADGPREIESTIEDMLRRDDLVVVHVDVTQNPFVGGYRILVISHPRRPSGIRRDPSESG